MISRAHLAGATQSVAQYSTCETYRYSLARSWDPDGRRVTFVMLNPSTADEMRNDPTVERCERRARSLGFGAFRVVNIFAFRATDPKDMRRADAPIGPENDAVLRDAAKWADLTICAWGTHGAHLDRGPKVAAMLQDAGITLHHLGLSKAGHPKHPLYISYSVSPMLWKNVGAVPV